MFTARFIPGFIVGIRMAITARRVARRRGFRADQKTPSFQLKDLLGQFSSGFLFLGQSIDHSGFDLFRVVLTGGGVGSGHRQGLFVGLVINRALGLTSICRSLLEGALICGAVLTIVGRSNLSGKILTFEEVPQRRAVGVMNISRNPHVVLLMIIGVLIILGMFMETLSTIIILVPVLLSMNTLLGIDPIHFGVILVVTNEMALLSSPLGANIFGA